MAVSEVDDVRGVMEYYSQFDDPLAVFKEKQKQLQVCVCVCVRLCVCACVFVRACVRARNITSKHARKILFLQQTSLTTTFHSNWRRKRWSKPPNPSLSCPVVSPENSKHSHFLLFFLLSYYFIRIYSIIIH